MKQRLQKIIASSGICSRRKAEELLSAGKVSLNGKIASLGESADPDLDSISINGKPLSLAEKKTYIMLNKPKGYVTTLSDEKDRPTVAELVRDCGARVYPVGRLDMYSEGLLILTNDGAFANRLMHPSGEVKKTYHAWLQGECTDASLRRLKSPLVIDGYKIKPAEVSVLSKSEDHTLLEISIHEGRNRQIRKMCGLSGVKLTGLKRVSEGGLRLGELKPGKWRYLTEEELQGILTEEL